MFRTLVMVALLLLAGRALAEAPDQTIHDELRGLLHGIEQAVNEERYGDLAPYFHQDMRVTTINQEVLASPGEIAPYFQRWFGPGGFLKKVDMTLTADALTRLDPEKRYGMVTGSGLEKYMLTDGRSFDMKTRWTATLARSEDGKWRILALHIGTDFLDNPVLAAVEKSLVYFAAGGMAAGLVIGLLVMAFLRRRKN